MIFQTGLESAFKNRQGQDGFNLGDQLVPNNHSAIRKASLPIRCFITWDLKTVSVLRRTQFLQSDTL